jgi:hypothetical protein
MNKRIRKKKHKQFIQHLSNVARKAFIVSQCMQLHIQAMNRLRQCKFMSGGIVVATGREEVIIPASSLELSLDKDQQEALSKFADNFAEINKSKSVTMEVT